MSLAIKYRPETFDDFVGNGSLVKELHGVLENDPVPNAFLFSGPTGCGKTTLARIVAFMLDCKGTDLIELDVADVRGIDTIRDMRRNADSLPMYGNSRIWILDEAHQLTSAAQNALLKALEDAPKHVHYILCTTDPNKLIKTVRGRCVHFNVTPLSADDLYNLLLDIVEAEDMKATEEALDKIVEVSEGLPRHALNILQRIVSLPVKEQLEAVENSFTPEANNQIIDLCRALFGNADWKKVAGILKTLKDSGVEAEAVRRGVMGYAQAILLKGQANMTAGGVLEVMCEGSYIAVTWPQLTFMCFSIRCGGGG